MIAPALTTDMHELKLVTPDVERDAALGVVWLSGSAGRKTLKLMGVTDSENKGSTLKHERERVSAFVTRKDQLNWMIEYAGIVVGSIWVDLDASVYLAAPSVHIMIGDTSIRSKGVGSASVRAVTTYLSLKGAKTIYSRHLNENLRMANTFKKLGFENSGNSYQDGNGLTWQNVMLRIQ